MLCRKCAGPIPAADISAVEDVALCRACGTLTRLGPDDALAWVDGSDLGDPPPGCRVVQEEGGVRLIVQRRRTASARAVPVMLVGFIVGSVAASLGLGYTTYQFLTGGSAMWNAGGAELFVVWALFVAAEGLFARQIAQEIHRSVGRVEVRVRGSEGVVLSGVGRIVRRERFNASAVKSVSIGEDIEEERNEIERWIELRTGRKVKFGHRLPEEQLRWLLGACRRLLIEERLAARAR